MLFLFNIGYGDRKLGFRGMCLEEQPSEYKLPPTQSSYGSVGSRARENDVFLCLSQKSDEWSRNVLKASCFPCFSL